MKLYEMMSALLSATFLMFAPGDGCGGEISGQLASHDCWLVEVGSADMSVKAGSVSASGLCVTMNGDNPTDANGDPCPKLTSITISSFRDIDNNGQKDNGEPGNSLQIGSPDGPPSTQLCAGTFSANVGQGVGGPVITNVTVTTEDGDTVAVYENTSY